MAAINLQADAVQRQAIYRRLERRNRLVAILRIGVPLLGVIVLTGLLGQIYLSSLTGRFGVGQVSVSSEAITIDVPEYSGVLDNGTTYRVWASSARAAIESPNQIVLTQAELTMRRTTGVTTQIKADHAVLDAGLETVTIPGVANVAESSGTAGTIVDSVFDYAAQALLGRGAVHVDYADGTTLDGTGMTYDVDTAAWTFSRVTVNLPYKPGSETP
ncbi:MAG: hypothetical protein ACOH2L_07775 [Devosia sp.]